MAAEYQCDIHGFETTSRGQMQQHIDYEHPGGAAKDSVDDFLTEQYIPCQNCGKPVDTLEPGHWKAPNDEQWWHADCFDKIEKAEELADRVLALLVEEGEHDGYSEDFHDLLGNAHNSLALAAEKERLKQEQGIHPYGGDDG